MRSVLRRMSVCKEKRTRHTFLSISRPLWHLGQLVDLNSSVKWVKGSPGKSLSTDQPKFCPLRTLILGWPQPREPSPARPLIKIPRESCIFFYFLAYSRIKGVLFDSQRGRDRSLGALECGSPEYFALFSTLPGIIEGLPEYFTNDIKTGH